MPTSNIKKLYRSRTNKIIAGICGGLGEYYATDPTIVRVIYVVLTIFTGVIPLIVIYLLLWAIVPVRP